MGVYIKEICPVIESEGVKKLSILVECSLKSKSVYFEVYNIHEAWYAYWNYEVPVAVIVQELKNFGSTAPVADIFKNEEFLRRIRSKSEVYKCKLNDDNISIINQLLDSDLPEVEPSQLCFDGYNFTLKIGSDGKEYTCHGIIPREWAMFCKIVNILMAKAGLWDTYHSCSDDNNNHYMDNEKLVIPFT